MAFSTNIDVEIKLPIINGFVSIPDGQQFLRTKLTAIDVLALIPGSSLMRMGARGSQVQEITVLDPTSMVLSGRARLQSRLWVKLPAHDRLDGPDDWFEILRDAAEL